VSATQASNRRVGNRLLATLPRSEYQRIAPRLEAVSLNLKQVIYDRSTPVKFVYFPINSVVSLVARMTNGDMIEVATIGKEGMVGLPVFLRMDRTQLAAFAQIQGQALRMKATDFRHEVERNGSLAMVLFRYTQAFLVQVAQAGACNQLHNVQQRCARWLLMSHERVGRDEFMLTQEFLCQMLSVRRATVSQVASALQDAGLIRYTRGRMIILDRVGLEAVSCECYQVIRSEYERVFSRL
jgi:CRP-like cAMP-binding protein